MDTEQIILITGGTGDLGTSMVKQFSKLSAQVIAVDILSTKEATLWKEKVGKNLKNVHYRRIDVSSFEDCKQGISDILAEFKRIDVLINNAGITRDAVFYKMTKEQWDEVLTVNLYGMFNVTRNVVEQMRAQNYGRIVNVSSVNAQKGQFSQANYAASKSGVYGFTKSLAQELMSHNITVNSISPGYVNTRLMKGIRQDILDNIISQIPAKRLAEPKEIAWAVSFLISKNSSYITGSNLSINGGLHMY